jgi:hypothetical protein
MTAKLSIGQYQLSFCNIGGQKSTRPSLVGRGLHYSKFPLKLMTLAIGPAYRTCLPPARPSAAEGDVTPNRYVTETAGVLTRPYIGPNNTCFVTLKRPSFKTADQKNLKFFLQHVQIGTIESPKQQLRKRKKKFFFTLGGPKPPTPKIFNSVLPAPFVLPKAKISRLSSKN